jgi:hypothetical protein
MAKLFRSVMAALSIRRKDPVYRWYHYHHL